MQSTTVIHDIAIIGGGINGCGIARDAAGRGYSVFLCEQNDLASATSSASTKLIHGGLRYLEQYEFRLVREALVEREVLWRIAPHIVRPLRFVLPHHGEMRPKWLLRLGLLLYDHIGGRRLLPGTRTLDLTRDAVGMPLRPMFRTGFEYSDCWVDDSRLVVLNAVDAARRGATIRTRTALLTASREDGVWVLTVEDRQDGRRQTIRSRILVNAAGAWVAALRKDAIRPPISGKAAVRLVQGSHVVVPRLYDHDRCYIFQNADRRIVFAIPYEDDFTLIGTTDRDFQGDPAEVSASDQEIDYLCAAVSEYFRLPVGRGDVVWSYSGVRPLYDDGATEAQTTTRDYVLTLDGADSGCPVLSVFGGKITTYRKLAEAALERLAHHLPVSTRHAAGWTGQEALPGGDFDAAGVIALERELQRAFPFLDRNLPRRLIRTYGRRAFALLDGAKSAGDLGRSFAAGLSEAEIRFLVEQEWARSGADILWRRTKLGLHMSEAERAEVESWIVARRDVSDPADAGMTRRSIARKG